MKKHVLCLATAVIMAIGTAVPVMAAGITATPNNASVAVDGESITIGAYNIGGYNYFKLRDVAAALNGTGANFEVGYDATAKAIALTTGAIYSETGNELKDTAPTAKKTATVSNQKIILDGREVSMQAYLIDGYNYFQLRELGKSLGFDVTWDANKNAINMVTNKNDATTDWVGLYRKYMQESDDLSDFVCLSDVKGNDGIPELLMGYLSMADTYTTKMVYITDGKLKVKEYGYEGAVVYSAKKNDVYTNPTHDDDTWKSYMTKKEIDKFLNSWK